MSRKPVSLRIPEDVKTEIDAIARQTKRSFASVANEMLREDLKMRRVRGIYFGDEFSRREPKVGGTGLGVWEVIQTYKSMDDDWKRLKAYYEWLDEFQLRMALEYYAAYPAEIEDRIAQNENFSIEEFWAKYPATKPPWAASAERSFPAVKA